MRVYLDASVLVAIILQQPGSPEQRHWLIENAAEILMSSFGWGEFVDAIARTVRAHTLTIGRGYEIVTNVEASFEGLLQSETIDADVREGAAMIASDMTRGLKLGDAIHLAICRRLGAILLTGNRRQAAAAAAFDIPNHLILTERT